MLSPMAVTAEDDDDEVDIRGGGATTTTAFVPVAGTPVVLLDGELEDDEAGAATTGEAITDSLANGLAVPRKIGRAHV